MCACSRLNKWTHSIWSTFSRGPGAIRGGRGVRACAGACVRRCVCARVRVSVRVCVSACLCLCLSTDETVMSCGKREKHQHERRGDWGERLSLPLPSAPRGNLGPFSEMVSPFFLSEGKNKYFLHWKKKPPVFVVTDASYERHTRGRLDWHVTDSFLVKYKIITRAAYGGSES